MTQDPVGNTKYAGITIEQKGVVFSSGMVDAREMATVLKHRENVTTLVVGDQSLTPLNDPL